MWINRKTYEAQTKKTKDYILMLERTVMRLTGIVYASGAMNLPPFIPQASYQDGTLAVEDSQVQLHKIDQAIDSETEEFLRKKDAQKPKASRASPKKNAKDGKRKSRGRRSV